MELEPQVSSTGEIRLVAPDKGTVATLSPLQITILYHLANPLAFVERLQQRIAPPLSTLTGGPWRRVERGQLLPPLSPWPGPRSAPLIRTMHQLRRLGLIDVSERGQIVISAGGRRLMRWLTHDWDGWRDYTRRFPIG